MDELERVKQILGVGFAGSISTAVESQKTALDELKSAVGLSRDASPEELQKKITALKSEQEAAEKSGTTGKTVSGKKEETKGFFRSLIATGERVVGWCTFGGIAIGTVWIALYASQVGDTGKALPIIGVAALLGGAFFMTGCLLGFLFGIPKQKAVGTVKPSATVTKEGTAPTGASPQGTVELEANTNLEQVSDWLTKIVVGVGLTQIHSMPDWLKKYADAVAPSLGPSSFTNARALAVGILIYYLTLGFLSGYLLTRLYLTKELEEAEHRGGSQTK
jgi:hypothetical protein